MLCPPGTLLSWAWCCPHHCLQAGQVSLAPGVDIGVVAPALPRAKAGAGGVRAGGLAGLAPSPHMGGHGAATGTAPLTDAEQLLLPRAGRGLKTLQKPSGDMEDVVGVREESFQVKLGQLKGTKMPQAKPNTSVMDHVF